MLVFGPAAVVGLGPGDDVGLHADGEIAVVGTFHRAPAEIAVVAIAGVVHVDPRAMDRAAFGQFPKGSFLHANAVLHLQDVADGGIVDDKHGASSPYLLFWRL